MAAGDPPAIVSAMKTAFATDRQRDMRCAIRCRQAAAGEPGMI
jgi:hypothetical protein